MPPWDNLDDDGEEDPIDDQVMSRDSPVTRVC